MVVVKVVINFSMCYGDGIKQSIELSLYISIFLYKLTLDFGWLPLLSFFQGNVIIYIFVVGQVCSYTIASEK